MIELGDRAWYVVENAHTMELSDAMSIQIYGKQFFPDYWYRDFETQIDHVQGRVKIPYLQGSRLIRIVLFADDIMECEMERQ